MEAKQWRAIQRVVILFSGLWIGYALCGPVILHHLRLVEMERRALGCGERERDLWDRMAAQRVCELQIEPERSRSGYESSYGMDRSAWWWEIMVFAFLPPAIVFTLLWLGHRIVH